MYFSPVNIFNVLILVISCNTIFVINFDCKHPPPDIILENPTFPPMSSFTAMISSGNLHWTLKTLINLYRAQQYKYYICPYIYTDTYCSYIYCSD